MRRSFVLTLAAAMVVVGCNRSEEVADEPQPDAEPVAAVLPGRLDLPVLEGSFIPEDCLFDREAFDEDYETGCVAMDFADEERMGELDAGYVAALEERGWTFAGGNGFSFMFHRPTDDPDCVDRVFLMGEPLATREELDRLNAGDIQIDAIEHFKIGFYLSPEPVCGEERLEGVW